MSIRASQCPMQWCAPPPNPKCGGRSAMMSNRPPSPTASGSVLAGYDSRCSVVPSGSASPPNSMSSVVRRVAHITVGFQRISSSTAFAASSGRSARSAHWSGCSTNSCIASPSWFLVVSIPPNTISDTIASSSMSDSDPSSASCACTRLETTSSRGRTRRSAISSSDTAYRFCRASSIRPWCSRIVTPNDSPRSVDQRDRSCQRASSMPISLHSTRAA